MKVFNMKKKDFEVVPRYKGMDGSGLEFESLVIIPTKEKHDSGWMCMDFVAVGFDGEPICRMSGWSDVLELDGVGGLGKDWLKRYKIVPELTPPKSWKIDCLPCGYLRLLARGKLTVGHMVSSFEVFAE